MIGLVIALPAEARAVTGYTPRSGSDIRLADGTRIELAGMGRERAMAAARRLLAEGAEGLLSFGVATGLTESAPSGYLLLPEAVLAVSGQQLPTHDGWRECWLRSAYGLAVGTGLLAEAARVLEDAPSRRQLAGTGAVAADMESAAVLEAAREAAVPGMVVRAVVDGHGRALPRCALAALDGSGAPAPIAFLAALARRPWELLVLPALALDMRRALGALSAIARQASPISATLGR